MKGDFTRLTFRPENHYRSVRVQQGRVQLDADWNEQADIEVHRDETSARDQIGRQGAPWTGGGFQVGSIVVPRSLRAIEIVDGLTGVIVGDDATILRMLAIGTWFRQDLPLAIRQVLAGRSLRGVSVWRPAGGSSMIFVVGDGGIILNSNDGGQTWTRQLVKDANGNPLDVTATLRAVHSISGQRAVAVGDSGTILLTVNGSDWHVQAAPAGVASTLRAVQLMQSGGVISGVIVGDNATILTTVDGGNTWTKQQAPVGIDAHLRGVHFPSTQAGYAVGDLATILATSNGGVTWNVQAVPAAVTANLRAVRFSDATHGTAVGDGGTVLTTTNGGTTWPKVASIPGTATLRAVTMPTIAAPPPPTLITQVVGDDSSILINDAAGWRQQDVPRELGITAGHLYVDGILCENERNTSLAYQPDSAGITIGQGDPETLVYLDVWERHLTAVERPELREVALGGPDSTTRTKTVWQVKSVKQVRCQDVPEGWSPPDRPAGTGRLAARAAPVPPVTDVCLVPATGGYRRLENQLYRIEIHSFRGTDAQGNFQPGSFKWSPDNGSTIAAVERIQDSMIKVVNPANSPLALSGFAGARWVEVLDDATVVAGAAGPIVKVNDAVDSSLPIADGTTLTPPGPGALVRRWDSGAIPIQIGTWIKLGVGNDLEGVEIRFDEGTYQVGDYWLIPARTLTGAVEWPSLDGEALALPRRGVLHHYATLGTITWEDRFVFQDCRRQFPMLTDLATLFYVGGDGQECLPEDELAKPLQVAASVPGRVRFVADHGAIAASSPVPTPGTNQIFIDASVIGQPGVYTCFWRPDPTVANRSQRVEATLLDANGDPTGKPIHFSATLSLAGKVQYDPSGCAALAGANVKTVQAALDTIMGLQQIHYLSGDGQESLPNVPLSQPLRVDLSSTCTPGASVRFEAQGNGRLAQKVADLPTATNQVDIPAANGIAGCFWQLDPAGSPAQTVVGTMLAQGQKTGISVVFTGNLSLASQVAYDPRNCENLGGATTVQAAIDKLCTIETKVSTGVHVSGVRLAAVGADLVNESVVKTSDLAQGINIICDGELDAASVSGKPVVTVTVEVPYPVAADDRDLWGGLQAPIGTQPVVLIGEVSLDSTKKIITWSAGKDVLTALESFFRRNRLGLAAHLVVKGNFIWSADATKNLDALAFAPRSGTKAGLQFPTTDSPRGGHLEILFRIGG